MDRLTKTDAELLQAYKDTGLEPEELTTVCKLCDDYVSAGLDARFIQACINAVQSGMSTERITEITKAEAEGRLIVVPSDPCEMADVAQEILSRACRLQREAEVAMGGEHDA